MHRFQTNKYVNIFEMHFNFIRAMYTSNLVLKDFLRDEIMRLHNKINFQCSSSTNKIFNEKTLLWIHFLYKKLQYLDVAVFAVLYDCLNKFVYTYIIWQVKWIWWY